MNQPIIRGLHAKPIHNDSALCIEVYVACGDASSMTHWTKAIALELNKLSGGCTVFPSEGFWSHPDGYVVRECTYVVRSYIQRADLIAGLPALRRLLTQYGRETEQSSVCFTLDGILYGFDPNRALAGIEACAAIVSNNVVIADGVEVLS
jgi:hypothetical protein